MTLRDEGERMRPLHRSQPKTKPDVTSDGGGSYEQMRSGAPKAEVDGMIARVRDARGTLLFEHDASSGRTLLRLPDGPLSIDVPGDVSLTSAGHVRLEGKEGVSLRAGGESDMRVLPSRVAIQTPEIDARAELAELTAREMRLIAETVSTAADAA